MKTTDFSFEVINENIDNQSYTGGCSNDSRSTCCTRTCRKITPEQDDIATQANTVEAWADYYELNAGVIQY